MNDGSWCHFHSEKFVIGAARNGIWLQLLLKLGIMNLNRFGSVNCAIL